MFFARPAFASRLPDFGAEHAGKRLVFGGKRTQNKAHAKQANAAALLFGAKPAPRKGEIMVKYAAVEFDASSARTGARSKDARRPLQLVQT